MPQISPMKWIFLGMLTQITILQAIIVSFTSYSSLAYQQSLGYLSTSKISWQW